MKKTLLKVCVYLLAFCFLLCTFSVASYAEENADEATLWDGTSTAGGFHSGDGSLNDPYRISTPEEFNYFAMFVTRGGVTKSKYFILTNDLDFGGHPISPVGTKDNKFSGTFDGCAHSIRNFRISDNQSGAYVGLFANINGSAAMVKNFTVENAVFSGEQKAYVGAIAGFLTNGTISNVTVAETVQVLLMGEGSIGGMVGRNYATLQYSVCNAIVKAEAESNSLFTGGIAGVTGNGTGVTKGCIFGGSVTANAGYTGGISGILGAGKGGGRLENCIHLGTCTSQSTAGGILGRVHTATGNSLISCTNLSTSVSGADQAVGTVIGDIANPAAITDCTSVEAASLPFYGKIAGSINAGELDLSTVSADSANDILKQLQGVIAALAEEEARIEYGTGGTPGDETEEDTKPDNPDQPSTPETTAPSDQTTKAPDHGTQALPTPAGDDKQSGGCASVVSGSVVGILLLGLIGFAAGFKKKF